MTNCPRHLEDHPRSPSCPRCGGAHSSSVEATLGTYVTRGYKVNFLCCRCHTIFVGSTEEWDLPRNSKSRETWGQHFDAIYRERYPEVSVLERERVNGVGDPR